MGVGAGKEEGGSTSGNPFNSPSAPTIVVCLQIVGQAATIPRRWLKARVAVWRLHGFMLFVPSITVVRHLHVQLMCIRVANLGAGGNF